MGCCEKPVQAKNINPYLIDAETVWIESRKTLLCDVPEIGIGNKPIDARGLGSPEIGLPLFERYCLQQFPMAGTYWDSDEKIGQSAQAILDARARFPESSLADLYDEVTMPPILRKAHQDNDRAVMEAYGFNVKMTENECVAELMKLYRKIVEKM